MKAETEGIQGETPERPKLLFLSQLLPHPPDTGARIRTSNVVRQLAKSYDLTMLCFHRDDARETRQTPEARARALEPYGSVETFPIPQERSRARLLGDHLTSLVSGRVYTRYAYRSAAFEARLKAALAQGPYELAHVDSLDLARYLPLLEGMPVVLVHHDATSVQLERRAGEEVTTFRRWYLARQAELMRREERRCLEASVNVTVSEVDRDTLRRIAGGGRFEVIPNGVDVQSFVPAWETPQSGIVFVGGAEWFPNRDALEFFAEDILPVIRRAEPDAAVTWVGRASDEDQRRYREEHDIELTGYVDDIRPYVHQAACSVIPIRIGSGTRVKILDAWAMGKAVVSTSVGAEGLGGTDGEQILLRDEPEAFAEAVVRVLQDAKLRDALGRSGRAFVEDRFSWDAIGERMRGLYADVAAGNYQPA